MLEFLRRRPQGQSGVLTGDYHQGRQTRRSLRYRLRRRTDEVIRCVDRYGPRPPGAILDIGTADALMLVRLRRNWPGSFCVGIDLARDLLAACPEPDLPRLLCDAQHLPLREARFDLLVATAVIEHVPDPLGLLRTAAACLRGGGLLVLTSPDPFWEHVATLVGHLPDEQHHEVLPLHRLAGLCREAGLQVLETRHFMLSPVGLPWELFVERQVRRLGLTFLFANQLVAARRL